MPDHKDIFRRLERQYYRDRMGALGLSTVEGMLLRFLGRQGQTRQDDLVVQLVLDKGAVARALGRLEERTVSDRCRREKLVRATEEGAALAGAIQKAVEEWDQVCFQGFSPQEQALFTDFFTRMTENVMKYKQGESEHG